MGHIQCSNVTSDDPALNWDAARRVTGSSGGAVAAVLQSWRVAERLCGDIITHKRPPWLLLHLHRLFYCSRSRENRGNNIIFAGSRVSLKELLLCHRWTRGWIIIPSPVLLFFTFLSLASFLFLLLPDDFVHSFYMIQVHIIHTHVNLKSLKLHVALV